MWYSAVLGGKRRPARDDMAIADDHWAALTLLSSSGPAAAPTKSEPLSQPAFGDRGSRAASPRGRRPRTAGAARAGAGAGGGAVRRQPLTAPALLRGEAPLFPLGCPLPADVPPQDKALDTFRHCLEDREVRKKKNIWRREGAATKELAEVMSHAHLNDLKVFHNASQRARTAAQRPASAPVARKHQRGGQKEAGQHSAVQARALREISDAFRTDMARTCKRIGLDIGLVDKDGRNIALEGEIRDRYHKAAVDDNARASLAGLRLTRQATQILRGGQGDS